MPHSIRVCLTTLVVAIGLHLPLVASAQSKPVRIPEPMTIEAVRGSAQRGDYVIVQGEVQRSKKGTLFEIQDETGVMVVRIPDHLSRKLGTPNRYETIRVMGQFDHKTFIDSSKTDGDPESTWGVRVTELQRNIVVNDRNPAAEATASPPQASPVTPSSPAALSSDSGPVTVIKPRASVELKTRMKTARDGVQAAQERLESYDLQYARAIRGGADQMTLMALQGRREAAEDDLRAARSMIPPLVEEARSQGVDDSVLRMYESGL